MSSRLVYCDTNNPADSVSANDEKCSVCGQLTSASRRKRICTFCLQSVCIRCIPFDPRSRFNKACSVCQLIICSLTTRSDLEQLKTQHLVRFVDANRLDRRGCRDKSEIVELILRSRIQIPYAHPSNRTESVNTPQQLPFNNMGRSQLRAPLSARQNHSSNVNSNRGTTHFSSTTTNSNPLHYQQWYNGFEQSMSSLANGMTSLANQMVASANAFRGNCPSSTPQNPMNSTTSPLFQTTTTVLHPGDIDNIARTMTTMTTRMTIQPEQHVRSRAGNRSSASRRQQPVVNVIPTPPMPSILLVEIKCQSDIDKMTTKQMKELLEFHLVSIRGCIEQGDLKEKVKELWEDEKEKRRIRDQSEKNDSDGRHLCKICMNDAIDCVFVDCGHMVTCLDCGKKLQSCPICRQNIVKVIKTFRS